MEEERDKRIEERKKAEQKKAEEEKEPKLGIVEITDDKPAEKAEEKAEEVAPEQSFPDQKVSENGKQAPNSGNGGKTDKYYWVQSLSDLDIYISLPPGF